MSMMESTVRGKRLTSVANIASSRRCENTVSRATVSSQAQQRQPLVRFLQYGLRSGGSTTHTWMHEEELETRNHLLLHSHIRVLTHQQRNQRRTSTITKEDCCLGLDLCSDTYSPRPQEYECVSE